jgi:hypothetical protein
MPNIPEPIIPAILPTDFVPDADIPNPDNKDLPPVENGPSRPIDNADLDPNFVQPAGGVK